jgi:hypothetical protein
MCQSCIEIDKRIEQYRRFSHSTTDPTEVEILNRLILYLFAERVRRHQNPSD